MTPKTLRKERIQKFRDIICRSEIYIQCRLDIDALADELSMLCAELADAAESRTERKTDETQPHYGTAYNRGEQEKPDKLKAMLDMVSFPGAKESAKMDALLSAYGVAFTVNSETAEWKKLAKHAISEQKAKGWEPAVFIEWVKKQNGFAEGFWSARRMLSEYPKAYKPQEQSQEKAEVKLDKFGFPVSY